MHRTLAVLLSTGLALAPFGASFAQNPQAAPPGDPHPPVASPSAPSPPPEKVAPRDDAATGKGTLSDKLAQQNGTLQPPSGVDSGTVINPPAQAGSTMPVIPPPGTQGGNQKVVPK